MILDVETNELKPCQCGNKPKTYSVGYGSTPYNVHCSGCKKQTNYFRAIGGTADNIIGFWNQIAPLKELTDEKGERKAVYQIKDKVFEGKKAKWNMRSYLLEECPEFDTFDSTEVYRLFDNGRIRMDVDFIKNEIYWKGTDY